MRSATRQRPARRSNYEVQTRPGQSTNDQKGYFHCHRDNEQPAPSNGATTQTKDRTALYPKYGLGFPLSRFVGVPARRLRPPRGHGAVIAAVLKPSVYVQVYPVSSRTSICPSQIHCSCILRSVNMWQSRTLNTKRNCPQSSSHTMQVLSRFAKLDTCQDEHDTQQAQQILD